MTPEEARTALSRLVAAAQEPVLDEAALDGLVSDARVTDRWGLAPEDSGWTPTYDLNRAAAAGWDMKAGLAAGDYNFAASGQRFDRAQVNAMCMRMAEIYRRRVVRSVHTGRSENQDLIRGGVRVNG